MNRELISLVKCPRACDLLAQKEALGDKDFQNLQSIQRCVNEVISFVRKVLGEREEQNAHDTIIFTMERALFKPQIRQLAKKALQLYGYNARALPVKQVPEDVLKLTTMPPELYDCFIYWRIKLAT